MFPWSCFFKIFFPDLHRTWRHHSRVDAPLPDDCHAILQPVHTIWNLHFESSTICCLIHVKFPAHLCEVVETKGLLARSEGTVVRSRALMMQEYSSSLFIFIIKYLETSICKEFHQVTRGVLVLPESHPSFQTNQIGENLRGGDRT